MKFKNTLAVCKLLIRLSGISLILNSLLGV